ncbi:hypothetical protein CRN58_24025, partial [Vibrio vulnificus]
PFPLFYQLNYKSVINFLLNRNRQSTFKKLPLQKYADQALIFLAECMAFPHQSPQSFEPLQQILASFFCKRITPDK